MDKTVHDEHWPPAIKLQQAYSQNADQAEDSEEDADTKDNHGYCVLTDNTDNRDNSGTTHIIGRVFIENYQPQAPISNFLLALRSHNFGRQTTIDVVATSHDRHRKLAYDYWERMDPQFASLAQHRDSTGEFLKLPYALAGGLLSVGKNKKLNFRTGSKCFSGELFDVASPSIAAYVAESCDFDLDLSDRSKDGTAEERKEKIIQAGRRFIGWWLGLCHEHKGADSFCENLLSTWRASPDSRADKLSVQQQTALENMRARDRELYRSPRTQTVV